MSVTSRLAHLGIAVLTLEAAEDIYRGLGLAVVERVVFPQEGLRLGFISSGDVAIELLEPQDPDTPLARFLSTRGQGIHHLAFEVPDIELAMARAREAGMRLIDKKPRAGAHDTKVAFIHPASAHGVLLELVQAASPQSSGHPVRPAGL
jgi:methylmalonyl-CoA/ethylmalonyl-CoA epimerase